MLREELTDDYIIIVWLFLQFAVVAEYKISRYVELLRENEVLWGMCYFYLILNYAVKQECVRGGEYGCIVWSKLISILLQNGF